VTILTKEHKCPYRDTPHENLAFVTYINGGNWCFSCNKGEFKSSDYYAFRDTTSIVTNKKDMLIPRNYWLPKRFSFLTLTWLYKYYVFDELIYKYSIRYSPYTYYTTKNGQIFEGESLIFPIIDNNEIVAYQQRFFPGKQFYSKDVKKYIFDAGNHNTSTVVLVEDFISAIRVGEIENCLWLQGTKLTTTMINYLIKNYTHIKIWLDGDEPGQEAASKIYKLLSHKLIKEGTYRAFAVREQQTLNNIVTEYDPKSYSNVEIRHILNNGGLYK
jgi:hypothetical protein